MGNEFRRPLPQGVKSRTRVDKIDIDTENANLQVQFEREMGEKIESHDKVAVLMLSWKKELEDDLDTADEVARLTEVFEKQYNFKVHHGEMTQERKAKSQINRHLADFVDEEDGKRTLLIIYYAGHGVENPENQEFVLAGGNLASPEKRRLKFNKEIVWREAETLIEDIDADMLLIFDCCHAGRVAGARTRAFSSRIFEVLAACQDDERTVAPGPESFTTALISALKELASTPDGFTTAQLYLKILHSRILPEGQHPYWNEKMGMHSLRRLKIQPIHDHTPPEETNHVDPVIGITDVPVKYFVNLSMMFAEMPTTQDITEICMALKEVVKPVSKQTSQVHQVRWRGLFHGSKLKEEFSRVAETFFWKWRAHTLEDRLKHQSINPSATIPLPPIPPQYQRPPLMPMSAPSPARQDGSLGAIEVSQLPHGDIRLHPTERRRPFLRSVYAHDMARPLLMHLFILVFGIILGGYRERLWFDSHFIPFFVGILPVEWGKTINETV